METRNGQWPNSLELAFLGDSVYDLYVREMLVRRGGRMKQLNAEAIARVRASAQSAAFLRLEPMLTDEERDVARRARNAKQTAPKNASPADYQRATALEALLGYLYLSGQTGRLQQILSAALDEGEQPQSRVAEVRQLFQEIRERD